MNEYCAYVYSIRVNGTYCTIAHILNSTPSPSVSSFHCIDIICKFIASAKAQPIPIFIVNNNE